MNVRIIVKSWVAVPGTNLLEYKGHEERAEIWRGEINIEKESTYITKVSIIADGEEHPICDIPFSLTEGFWQWVPPMVETEEEHLRKQPKEWWEY
jgi:hypothetical protein